MENISDYKLSRKPRIKDITGMSNTALHTQIKEGVFPPPISIGDRAVAFVDSEINAVLAARIAGKSKDEIKVIVAHLVEQRKNAGQVSNG